jgi:hypothetical protein
MNKFHSRYETYPYQEVRKIAGELKVMSAHIEDCALPQTKDELVQAELKRRLEGYAANLEQMLSGTCYDFSTVVSMYAIPAEDLRALLPWLEGNKEKTARATERLYKKTEVRDYEKPLPVDIPAVLRQASEFAALNIQKYHKNLGKLLQELTKSGEFLRDINAVPTTTARSYFDPITKTLAIGIPAICYVTEDGSLHIREREMIRLNGHEGQGHALNQVITESNGLPYFLRRSLFATEGTQESVAQFYEKRVFEDLKNSPETQKSLGIKHIFDEIYQDAKDARQIDEYQLKLFQYAITVLADKDLGPVQDSETMARKIDLINGVALNPQFAYGFVEQNRYNYDSQGNLGTNLTCELRYCANPIERAIRGFQKQGIKYDGDGRSKIDSIFYKGFWTPIGFVDNARLAAKE